MQAWRGGDREGEKMQVCGREEKMVARSTWRLWNNLDAGNEGSSKELEGRSMSGD